MKKHRDLDSVPPPRFAVELASNFDRLIQAGLIESYAIDQKTGRVDMEFSRDAKVLMIVGRRIQFEPAFQRLMAHGDPAAIRAWLRSEAADILQGRARIGPDLD